MKPLTNQEITWSVVELTGLLEDEDSHVHVVRTTKHLALHPYHLNNIQLGLNQILKSLLHTYDKELKGFVLTFKNPKLISNLGEILYDSPFIHIDVDAEFYLFRPLVGSCVKGIVNKKGLDHIVVLVHKIYTISIPKSDDAEEWLGDLVEIGQEVKCYISHIDYTSRPPFICATLKSDYLQGCRININDTVAVNGIENHSDSESRAASQLDCSQKRKINIDDNVAESRDTVGGVKIKVEKTSTPTKDEAVSDVERDSQRKKRKKRPKPDDDVSNDESEVVVKSEHDEALSDRERDSPRKKRKKRHKPDDDVPNGESEVVVKSEHDEALSDRERDSPRKKRKKRHKPDDDVPNDESEIVVKSEHDEVLSDRERDSSRKKRKKRHKPDEGVFKHESESIVKPERDETPSDRERDSQRKKRKRSRKPDEDVCKDEYADSERSKKARVLSDSESPSKLDCSQDRKMGIVITDAINGTAEDHSWINNVKVKQEKFSEVEDNVPSDRDQDRQRKKRKRTKSDV